MGPADHISYDFWQSELERLFFGHGKANEPVVLFVSREILSEQFPYIEDPLTSLARAVQQELQLHSQSHLFAKVFRKFQVWKKRGHEGPPPVLPLIALTVIAASDMVADEKGSPLMYYGRLQVVLGDNVTVHQIRTSYDELVPIWESLDEWIENQAWLGRSTILKDEHYSKIGYARSQALLTRRDAENLRDFFYAIGKKDLQRMSKKQKMRELARWDLRVRRLSQGLKSSLKAEISTESNSTLANLLDELANKWDGRHKAHQLQKRLKVELRLDQEDLSPRWVIARSTGLGQLTAVDRVSGKLLVLSEPVVGNFYRADGLPGSVAESIDTGRTWSSEQAIVSLKPRKHWIFSADPVSGDWVSTSTLPGYEEIVILVREESSGELTDLLERVRVNKFRVLTGGQQTVPGWDIFIKVRLGQVSDYDALADWLGCAHASDEAEDERPPSLANGLSLLSPSGSVYYLAGGEPDLIVPPTADGFYSLSIDGVDSGRSLRANGAPFPLHKVMDNASKRHTVAVDDYTLRFETISLLDHSNTPVAYTRGLPDAQQLASDARVQRVVLSRSAEHWLVLSSGRIQTLEPPDMPDWLKERGYEHSSKFVGQIPHLAAWYVRLRHGRPIHLKKFKSGMALSPAGVLKCEDQWRVLLKEPILHAENEDWAVLRNQIMAVV